LKSDLETKLFDFKRDEDKKLFLLTIKKVLLSQKVEHYSVCEHTQHCPYIEDYKTALFVVGQELEVFSTANNYTVGDDYFSELERTTINAKIDEIIDRLKAMDLKTDVQMEVLYEELEDLKQRMQYDKKTFWQLVKGKLMEAVSSDIVNKTVAKEIYDRLAENITNVSRVIDTIG
jgi:hypothetical protein